MAVDVVPITQTSKLLLSRGIPDIELDVAQVLPCLLAGLNKLLAGWCAYCAESERVNLNTESRNVFLLELSSQMALDEGGLFIH